MPPLTLSDRAEAQAIAGTLTAAVPRPPCTEEESEEIYGCVYFHGRWPTAYKGDLKTRDRTLMM